MMRNYSHHPMPSGLQSSQYNNSFDQRVSMEVNRSDAESLADSRRTDYLLYGVRLYKAALRGDWATAKEIHDRYPRCFTERITKQGDTVLHIAALAKHTEFVLHLVSSISDDNSLALTNYVGNTALCLAAASGTVAIAEAMVKAHSGLPNLRAKEGLTPLHIAALLGHHDMVKYLLYKTILSQEEQISLFISTINTDLYDIALEIINNDDERRSPGLSLALGRDDQTRETPLHVMAKKSHNSCDTPQGFWSRCFNLCNKEEASETGKSELIKKLWERVEREPHSVISELMRNMFVAVEVGNVEFVTTLISLHPDLIWKLDDRNRSMFHVAVQFRQEKIFRLIYEIGAIKDLLATYYDVETHDNMLHLAAMLPSSDRLNCVSGAALQMQREMLWFKVVAKIVQPQLSEARNIRGQTPRGLFTEQHKELRKEGEEWMRKTAGSCSVVATLIAGMVFGAALFKVPGDDSDPLSHGAWRWVFAISDSLSLISSTASILMFLSILTSRYAEKDFLQSLPRKLMIGLTLLFISIATMMIAFTATFHIMFKHGLLWVGTAGLACIPIFLFALQEFPLLLEVFRSTIGSYSIFRLQHKLFCSA